MATVPLELEVIPVPRRPGEADDIRGIKDPMGFQSPPLWPKVLAALLLVAALIALILWLKGRSEETEEMVYTPLDAYEDALARLKDLRERRDSKEIDVKSYHYGFAEVLRIYLERRFAFTTLS